MLAALLTTLLAGLLIWLLALLARFLIRLLILVKVDFVTTAIAFLRQRMKVCASSQTGINARAANRADRSANMRVWPLKAAGLSR